MKNKNFDLSDKGKELIKKEMSRYETRRSCLIPCLWQIQKEKGWIPPEAIPWLSDKTGLPESQIHEVVMFYTMFNKKPVGKFHIQVCGNVSCAMQGSRELIEELCSHFQVDQDKMSECGNWTISKVECLGACDEAPVIQLNDQYVGKMKKDQAISFLESKWKALNSERKG